MATIQELLDYGKHTLENSGNEYAKYERKAILEHVLNKNYMYMLANGDESVSDENEYIYREMIERRASHYPLQYILGYAHFMDYTFYVDDNVLIPRSDTEVLVEKVNELFDNETVDFSNYRLLDMCCGSGCIGISLKLYHADIELTLSDISDAALSVANNNLAKYNITAEINCGNLWDGIFGKYNMIVCNPPYIESAVVATLMPEVREYEPEIALDGGCDGLDFYRKIISEAPKYLDNNGYMFFEIGYNQGRDVSVIMKQRGFEDVCIIKDYAGLDRVVSGHL